MDLASYKIQVKYYSLSKLSWLEFELKILLDYFHLQENARMPPAGECDRK